MGSHSHQNHGRGLGKGRCGLKLYLSTRYCTARYHLPSAAMALSARLRWSLPRLRIAQVRYIVLLWDEDESELVAELNFQLYNKSNEQTFLHKLEKVNVDLKLPVIFKGKPLWPNIYCSTCTVYICVLPTCRLLH